MSAANGWTAIESVDIDAGDGDDTISGSQFRDTIDAGTGTDVVATWAGSHEFEGDSADYELVSGGEIVDRLGATIVEDDDIYVSSVSGDDLNSGTSTNSPLWSIQAAVNMAGEGATINVKGGETYYEAIDIVDKLGTASSPIVIQPWPSTGVPVIDGETDGSNSRADLPDRYLIFELGTSIPDNFTVSDALLVIEDCQYISVKGLKIQNSRQGGITVRTTSGSSVCDNIVIEDCEIHYTRTDGIFVGTQQNATGGTVTGNPRATNITIRNNTLSNLCTALNEAEVPTNEDDVPQAQGQGITVILCNGFDVYGNDMSDHYKEGIDILSSKNGDVYRNWIKSRFWDTDYGDSGYGIYLCASDYGVEGVDVYNNVIKGDEVNEGQGIGLASERGADLDDIDIYNNVVSGMSFATFCMCGVSVHRSQSSFGISGL